MNHLEVVVGVATDPHGRLLVAQRPPGKVCAGQWEFPGGKIEPGESGRDALVREFKEELDIRVEEVDYLFDHVNQFHDRRVHLHVYRVRRFEGEPVGREGQALDWCFLDDIAGIDFLPGNLAMLPRLSEWFSGR